MRYRLSRLVFTFMALAALLSGGVRAQEEEKNAAEPPKDPARSEPPGVAPANLLPNLPTVPTLHGSPSFNLNMVDARALPRDREGIWILNFTFKPMRLLTIETGGKRRTLHYLYYRVVNRTGRPIQFVPQFTLVTDKGERFDDVVLPQAVKKIQGREDPTIPLLGAVNIMGVLPPSKKQGVDDAVYGVAIWDNIDPKADAYHVYVRGLSDGFQVTQTPGGGKPVVRYKTLRIDFIRHGDERHLNEKEIQLDEPPYEWVYW